MKSPQKFDKLSSLFSNKSQGDLLNLPRLPDHKEFLYTVKAVRDYVPLNEHEIELKENEIYHVSEERDYYLYVHSQNTVLLSPSQPQEAKLAGYAPKNFLTKQKPLISLLGFTINDYKAANLEELTTFTLDKLLIVAYEGDFMYCKKVNGIGKNANISGKVPSSSIFIEGDISLLPELSEYRARNILRPASYATLKRSSDLATRSLPRSVNNPKEEKTMSRLRAQTQYSPTPRLVSTLSRRIFD